MKHVDPKTLRDPNKVQNYINELEASIGQPLWDLENRQDVTVKIRVNESVPPAMFKPDPLLPGGYIANSLTIKAMRPDIFVLGESDDDLSSSYHCACGQELDIQFWKFCPYCSRAFNL